MLPHAEDRPVMAIDLLGHGYTDKPDHDYAIADYGRHVLDVLDARGWDRVHISGESLGGWIAAKLAADHPDRVEKLVLNTAGGFTANPAVMERLRALSLAAVRDPKR